LPVPETASVNFKERIADDAALMLAALQFTPPGHTALFEKVERCGVHPSGKVRKKNNT
jgi:hypothetical protein